MNVSVLSPIEHSLKIIVQFLKLLIPYIYFYIYQVTITHSNSIMTNGLKIID